MQVVKIFVITLMSLLFISSIGVNAFFARNSFPIAAYTTLFPRLMSFSYAYNDGDYYGISIGKPLNIKEIEEYSRVGCKFVESGRFVDFTAAKSNLIDLERSKSSGTIYARCSSLGLSWNTIFEIRNGMLSELRVSGGIWS